MDFQTRSETTGTRMHRSLQNAMKEAAADLTIWKVSFILPGDEPVRLVRTPEGWTYETIHGERFNLPW
jgi:hypothetical protein